MRRVAVDWSCKRWLAIWHRRAARKAALGLRGSALCGAAAVRALTATVSAWRAWQVFAREASAAARHRRLRHERLVNDAWRQWRGAANVRARAMSISSSERRWMCVLLVSSVQRRMQRLQANVWLRTQGNASRACALAALASLRLWVRHLKSSLEHSDAACPMLTAHGLFCALHALHCRRLVLTAVRGAALAASFRTWRHQWIVRVREARFVRAGLRASMLEISADEADGYRVRGSFYA